MREDIFYSLLEMNGESAKLIISPRWHSQWVAELVLNPSVFSKLCFCAIVILSPLSAYSFLLSLWSELGADKDFKLV